MLTTNSISGFFGGGVKFYFLYIYWTTFNQITWNHLSMWTYFDLFCFRKIIYLSIFFSFHLFFPLLTLHCVYRHNVTTCPKQQWRANFSTAFKKGKKKVFAFQLLDIYVFMSVYNVCIQACVYAHTHFFICSSNKSLHCEACRFLFHIFAHPVKKKKKKLIHWPL